MSNPNFESMSRKELQAYVLENRDNDAAFYALMDKLDAIPAKVWHQAPKSIEDLSNFPQLLEEHRRWKKEPGEQD
jgi:hypothetical protein